MSYGVGFTWDTHRDSVDGTGLYRPAIKAFDHIDFSIENIEDFCYLAKNTMEQESSYFDYIIVDTIKRNCDYCGVNDTCLAFFSYDKFICSKCLEKALCEIKKIKERILLQSDEIIVVELGDNCDYPDCKFELESGDIAIHIYNSAFDNVIFPLKNYQELTNTIKDKISEENKTDNSFCSSCGSQIRNESASWFKGYGMFHDECLEEILKDLEKLEEKYTKEIVSRTV